MLSGAVLLPAFIRLSKELGMMHDARAPYDARVRSAAEKHRLSPALLSALLWTESRFDPDARGSIGEVGMGQMLGPAASDVSTSLALLEYDPELQIDKAAEYLRLMIDRAGGDIVLGLRAYNAGLRRAKGHPSISFDYAGRIIGLALVDTLIGGLA